MNATQDASNKAQNDINRQLISYNEKQNDLIFSLRKRLFDLEKIQNIVNNIQWDIKNLIELEKLELQ